MEIRLSPKMSVMDKLKILAEGAKYDVSCSSSGSSRANDGRGIGNTVAAGLCHSFAADGRCVSLLKILFTNECIYDCKYCINRSSNDVPRVSFTPDEVCDLTMEFYRRNYIEGLFLSSGILYSPNDTMELLCETLHKLRTVHRFQGYIHVKAIPGADPALIQRAGYLADRMSVNLEMATADGLKAMAPNKHRRNILKPMRLIQNGIAENRNELVLYKHAPRFCEAGQSTQMVVGALPESDYQIMSVAENLYNKFSLKRVYYSAFVNVNGDQDLPAPAQGAPLLREHRLYQADWLLRFYYFRVEELLTADRPNFNMAIDPKADWAVRHLDLFPVEINRADYQLLLRIPGVGVKSARRIVAARRFGNLTFEDLKRIGVVLKRALYFITCGGKMMYPTKMEEGYIVRNLTYQNQMGRGEKLPFMTDGTVYRQMSLFDMGSMRGFR
ncbi:MAG: putative DNA modification/repair radical SAM protein [Clostridiales bacterium]|nr:putative DNA modification/repair radical SAM protein [Clostridiales bacterium]